MPLSTLSLAFAPTRGGIIGGPALAFLNNVGVDGAGKTFPHILFVGSRLRARRLLEPDRSVAPPANSGEPCPRLGHRRCARWRRQRRGPAVEPETAGVFVDDETA